MSGYHIKHRYDQQANHARVSVGTPAVTAQLAVASIRRGWEHGGRGRYPKAHHLLIEADAGGCNGHRPRLWKRELQQLANDIEHRLFSQISRNWAGHPLRSLPVMLRLIRGTTPTTGLTVEAMLDPTVYVKGIEVTNQEMAAVNLRRRRLCPDLNYTIRPNKSGSS